MADTNLGTPSDAYVEGNRVATDEDYFEITVPAGGSIRAAP
jgi:hypothetical protein